MKLPSSWSDITIKQFNEVSAILQSETFDDLNKNIYLISILCNASTNKVEELSPVEFIKIAGELGKLILSPHPTKIPQEFTIKGVKYKYNALRPIETAGQYISLMDLGKKENNPSQNFHKILAVLCEPEETQDYKERVKIFYDNLTMDIVFPLSVFFSLTYPKLIQATQDCLMKEAKKEMIALRMEVMYSKRFSDGLKLLPPALRRVVKRGLKLNHGE